MFPTGRLRIVQIHPTRRCNLECLHCYSNSGPLVHAELHEDLVRRAIADASAEGFDVISFSGGEPLLFAPLPGVLEHARSHGLRTTIVTNGMLLDERRLNAIRDHVNLIAISLDGLPESHDLNRNRSGAFDRMAINLEGLRASGIPFGFIFMLTQYNLFELEWVAGYAVEQGAQLLQVHPLSLVGRAQQLLGDAHPDGLEFTHGFLEVERLRVVHAGRLAIQLDLMHRRVLAQHPDAVFAAPLVELGEGARLADLISPLVIETDGAVVPIEHGIDRRFALGNLNTSSLRDLARQWPRESYPAFRALCRQTYEELTDSSQFPFVNWYEEVGKRAQAFEYAEVRA